MYYDNYNFGGMHYVWWFVWVILIIWIFATPYDVPGQRKRKDTPLDVLKKRFASGEINQVQYWEHKAILDKQ